MSVAGSIGWSAAERVGAQLIAFGVMVVMARVIGPEAYGLVGMLAVFVAVGRSLAECGMSQAIVRLKELGPGESSAAMIFCILSGAAIWLLIALFGPLIARYYGERQLVELAAALGGGVLLSGIGIVPRALLTRKLDFRTQARASVVALTVGGSVGIAAALNGCGVWGVVAYQLVWQGVESAMLWIGSRFRPGWGGMKALNGLLSFGGRIALAGLIDAAWRNIYNLVVGRMSGALTLGWFTRALQLGEFPSANATGILQRVAYPVMSRLQGDGEALRGEFMRWLRLGAWTVFPVMGLLAGLADPVVIFLLGDEWEGCAGMLQILCAGLIWAPVQSLNLLMLQVKGDSRGYLRLEIIKKMAGVAILAATVAGGAEWICAGFSMLCLLSMAINMRAGYVAGAPGIMGQLRVMLPPLLTAAALFCGTQIIV